MAVLEIITNVDGDALIHVGDRWIESYGDAENLVVTINSVDETRTDCFTIVLRATLTHDVAKQEIILVGGGASPERSILRDWTDSTTLWTQDFSFKHIKGENLHNNFMAQLTVIQAAFDGYLKEQRIEERGAGALATINSSLVQVLDAGWNPSE